METFTFSVAPPLATSNVTATNIDVVKNPQKYFAGSDIVWMLISSGLVLLMVPAMCLFYSGASNRERSLTLFRLPLITAAFIGFQWYLWGYSLAFTPAVAPSLPHWSWFGGHSTGNALHDSLARPTGADGAKIPELLYQFYEGMFASFTASLVCGGTIRDVPVGRFLLFITLWSLLVYNPVARWSWHWAGWSNQYGVMDFAGGTAVHITSGTAVLAFYIFYALETKSMKEIKGELQGLFRIRNKTPRRKILLPSTNSDLRSEVQKQDSPRPHPFVQSQKHTSTRTHQDPEAQPILNLPRQTLPLLLQDQPGLGLGVTADESPHNVNNMVLGTALLWIGWFGFNGGSALGGNLRAVSACVSTHVAACAGGTTSLLWFWLWSALAKWGAKEGKKKHKVPSVTHFCDGVVIGLVAITPAAGYVPVWSAGIFGFVSAILVFFLKMLNRRIDQPLYIFSIHAGGGLIGMFLTGCFASQTVVGLDGYSYEPLLDRPLAVILRYQMLDAFMGFFYTLSATLAILYSLKALYCLWKWEWVSVFEETNSNQKRRLEATPQHFLREKSS